MAKASESRAESTTDTAPAKTDHTSETRSSEQVTQTAEQQERSEARSAERRDRKAKVEARECVVDDGTPHMGRATPGAVICSAHAMHYKADGTPRGE